MTDEVCSVDQNAEKPNVHKLQEMDKEGEAVVWELPSVVTTGQLVSPKSPSEKEIDKEESSINAIVQTTAGLRSSSSLTPHE